MAHLAENNRGWVSFRDGLWEECTVEDASEQTLKLRLKDGSVKDCKRAGTNFHYRNPEAVEDADDFLNLPNLDEPNILHSLRVRYWKHHVYSYTGPILIAVNPWRRVTIYEQSVLDHYKSSHEDLPHIFGIAARAHRAMRKHNKNQCVLISGEAGAGKTESTKQVLRVLTAMGVKDPNTVDTGKPSLETQVLMTNPSEIPYLVHNSPAPALSQIPQVYQKGWKRSYGSLIACTVWQSWRRSVMQRLCGTTTRLGDPPHQRGRKLISSCMRESRRKHGALEMR